MPVLKVFDILYRSVIKKKKKNTFTSSGFDRVPLAPSAPTKKKKTPNGYVLKKIQRVYSPGGMEQVLLVKKKKGCPKKVPFKVSVWQRSDHILTGGKKGGEEIGFVETVGGLKKKKKKEREEKCAPCGSKCLYPK